MQVVHDLVLPVATASCHLLCWPVTVVPYSYHIVENDCWCVMDQPVKNVLGNEAPAKDSTSMKFQPKDIKLGGRELTMP